MRVTRNTATIGRFALLCLLSFACCACGWQLRGFNKGQLPQELALKTTDPYAPFARQLQQTLLRRGVEVKANAPLRLWLDAEKLNKRTVAVNKIGAAAQYELQLKIAYSYQTIANPTPEPSQIMTQRVFDFTPGANLAKTEEEQTLLKEMRQELINRILVQGLKIDQNQPAAADSSMAASSANAAH